VYRLKYLSSLPKLALRKMVRQGIYLSIPDTPISALLAPPPGPEFIEDKEKFKITF
jgi:hypothetical protein